MPILKGTSLVVEDLARKNNIAARAITADVTLPNASNNAWVNVLAISAVTGSSGVRLYGSVIQAPQFVRGALQVIEYRLIRGSTVVLEEQVVSKQSSNRSTKPKDFFTVDVPSAGTHTYQIQARARYISPRPTYRSPTVTKILGSYNNLRRGSEDPDDNEYYKLYCDITSEDEGDASIEFSITTRSPGKFTVGVQCTVEDAEGHTARLREAIFSRTYTANFIDRSVGVLFADLPHVEQIHRFDTVSGNYDGDAHAFHQDLIGYWTFTSNDGSGGGSGSRW